MTVILVGVLTGLRLGSVIHSAQLPGRFTRLRRGGCLDYCALREIEVNIALKPDGEAKIGPTRKHHRSTARCCRCFYGSVHGRRIELLSGAGCSKGPHVKELRRARALGSRCLRKRAAGGSAAKAKGESLSRPRRCMMFMERLYLKSPIGW